MDERVETGTAETFCFILFSLAMRCMHFFIKGLDANSYCPKNEALALLVNFT